METNAYTKFGKLIFDSLPHFLSELLREITGVVKADLNKLETVIAREFRQVLEVAASRNIGKPEPLKYCR